ncbi:hypothetical protein ACQEU8_08225 [Streptomyces sp. CA-250714]|uniref:hypothetical protein n=1 Tax=Streptomyces sp. CA-250714 TaxID=3240060 RepID=UPI003D939608
MSTPSVRDKAPASLVGLLVGGAAGFLLTETVAALFAFAFDRTPEADGNGTLPAAFIAVPILCALVGAVSGARWSGRSPHRNRGW